MGQIKWYKRDPQDALDGMAPLSLEERGAYNTVLDLFYVRDGKLPDDDRFIAGFLGCDVRVWRRIRERLIDLGKLFVEAGHIHNRRADEELHTALARLVCSRNAGKASASSRARKSDMKPNNNNGGEPADVETDAPTGAATGVLSNDTKSSVPNGTGVPPLSLADRLWSDGLAVLTSCDVPNKQARSLLGKWRKLVGDAAVLELLVQCQAQSISEPVPWMEAAVRARGGPVVPFRRETEEERLKRERAEFVERNYGPDSPRARQSTGGGT